MRCIYCQNHEISHACRPSVSGFHELNNVLEQVAGILSQGIRSVGFVSPSHLAPQAKLIIKSLRSRGLNPTIIYNTNGYDKADVIRSMSDLVDVYLPDLKYVTPELARDYSGAFNYPGVALKALKEMYYQKGSYLAVDEEGRAESGLVIRHLVLPGHAAESIKVLETIASEISTGVHISLMSQYHPKWKAAENSPLDRTLYRSEYDEVVESMQRLGFRNGWIQELDSSGNYLPDFNDENPFE